MFIVSSWCRGAFGLHHPVGLVVMWAMVGMVVWMPGCQLGERDREAYSEQNKAAKASVDVQGGSKSEDGSGSSFATAAAFTDSDPSQSEQSVLDRAKRSPKAGDVDGQLSSWQSIDEMILFQPVKYPRGFRRLLIEGQRVIFQSQDGTQLDGRFFRSVKPRQVVLFCHGNDGNLSHRTARMDRLQEKHQVAIFLFDYRGYGRSAGKPTVAAALVDGRAALLKAAEIGKVDPADIIIMGRAMGGAIAATLATEFECKGLILESTFTSFRDVAKQRTGGMVHWMIPEDRLNTLAKIKDYGGRLLISHGTADRTIPYQQGRDLFAAANQPKRFFEIIDGGHDDPMPVQYDQVLDEFFAWD